MFSYEERLATFRQWPREFQPLLVKRLALIGQYSAGGASLTTVCVYCHKKLEDWKTTDVPLVEHFKHNDNCVLFYLRYAIARRVLLYLHKPGAAGTPPPGNLVWRRRKKTGVAGIDVPDTEPHSFVQFNIRRSTPFKFCATCGSMDTQHECRSSKIAQYDPAAPQGQEAFYIRWLRGDYLGEIDSYMGHDIYVPDSTKEVLRLILDRSGDAGPFDSLASVVSGAVHQLVADFEHQIQMLENKALEGIAAGD